MAEFVVPLAAGVAPGDCANSVAVDPSRRTQQAGRVKIGTEFMNRSSGNSKSAPEIPRGEAIVEVEGDRGGRWAYPWEWDGEEADQQAWAD